jgi:metallo-beta-lactamase family protein
MKLRFLGAAQTVTGSRNLIQYGNKHILIDAGLFQGPKDSRKLNWYPNINAKKIDAIILTHAHIDHSGLIPKLYKDGFRGSIFTTDATFDLCKIMLLDSAHLQEEDAKYANSSGYSSHIPAYPLYTIIDAEKSLELFSPQKRDEWIDIFEGVSIRFTRSGHILGSSFVEMTFNLVTKNKKIVFSGDLGNGRSKIIKPPVNMDSADYLILESTYGDRLQPRIDPKIELGKIINTVSKRNGTLVIPAFTVGRTQDLLYYLNELKKSGDIPDLPIYVDSPMANAANKIFLAHPEEHVLRVEGDKLVPPICLCDFTGVTETNESKRLTKMTGPMIIITASGMLTGGRVMHHLKERLSFKENGVLFVGFQAQNTKGRLLQDNIKSLRIFHEEVEVNCDIFTIPGLSAHADYEDILNWLSHFRELPQKIFINHGEMNAAQALHDKIKEKFNIDVYIPSYMEEINLED